MTSIKITKETGTRLNSIVIYLLDQKKVNKVPKEYRIKLEIWIMKKNEKYIFKEGEIIEIPDDKDIFDIMFAPAPTINHDDKKSPAKVPLQIKSKGWQLTKDRELIQGETGYLIDETGLYILEDGRRVTNAKEYEKLRIGDEDIYTGLFNILGFMINHTLLKDKYDTLELFKNYGPHIGEVVYQAFQINICYKIIKSEGGWQDCTRKRDMTNIPYVNSRTNPEVYVETAQNCKFKSIGTDETGIPIVVTRVGKETAINKLVIAGPHGDERNAQRLIMSAQKHFIQKGEINDTTLFFIPCLSPTMAFADARGIPIVDDKGYWNGKNAKDSIARTLKDYNSRVKTIPYLHDLIAKQIPRDHEGKKGKLLLRTLIQGDTRIENNVLVYEATNGVAYDSSKAYNDNKLNEDYPRYGIDANRDYFLALPSSNAFLRFIEGINTNSIPAQINNKTIQEAVYYNNREQIAKEILNKKIRVLMIHGYNDPGRPFGPYWVNENDIEKLPIVTENDMKHIDVLISNLNMTSIKQGEEKEYIWKETRVYPLRYLGEWVRRLYKEYNIWTCDIELERNYNKEELNYDEGVRNGTIPYNPSKIGDTNLEYFKTTGNCFLKLLEGYPWE